MKTPSKRTIIARVAGIMGAPAAGHRTLLEKTLFMASRLYGAAASLRAVRYDTHPQGVCRIGVPVVSVGNITVGGTGKTPMTVYIAGRLTAMGMRPVILSRGYGGRLSAGGGVVSDGRQVLLGAVDAGDEPVLMARALPGVPVVIGRDRVGAGRRAVARFDPDVVILDDAFQHRRIHRDVNLLLMDFTHPLGNGHLLPRGPLREPVAAARRAHAVVFTRSPEGGGPAPEITPPGIPVFCASHRPVIRRVVAPDGRAALDRLDGLPAFLFSGLANNDNFRYTVGRFGSRVVGHARFADHHPYTADELRQVQDCAQAAGAQVLITTDKDIARIGNTPWRLTVVVVGVDIDLGEDGPAFDRFLAERLAVGR